MAITDAVDIDIRVRYAETDQMGVAYYANYLVWFEVGRSELCRSKGFRYADLEASGYKLVVTEARCRYRNAVRYDEIIRVRTSLKGVNRRMITFAYRILRKEKDDVVAEGETQHLCIDLNGRPKSLPKEFAASLTG